MSAREVPAIPELALTVALSRSDPPHVACRLTFDRTPVGTLSGSGVKGPRVQFEGNVFHRVARGRISVVRSAIDKAAIAGQHA